MPKVATSGFTNVLRDVNDTDFTWSAGDTGAKILALTAPRDFFLPGPTTDTENPNANNPSDGDFYDLLDPLGLLSGNNVTVHGGGYNIQGGATVLIGESFVHIRFTFCSTPGIAPGGAWTLGFCSCGGG